MQQITEQLIKKVKSVSSQWVEVRKVVSLQLYFYFSVRSLNFRTDDLRVQDSGEKGAGVLLFSQNFSVSGYLISFDVRRVV